MLFKCSLTLKVTFYFIILLKVEAFVEFKQKKKGKKTHCNLPNSSRDLKFH